MDKRIIFIILSLLTLSFVVAQNSQAPQQSKKRRVDLLYADRAQADKLERPDVQVLVGSVRLRHDSMYMSCDSAIIFEATNSVEAFGNVHMEQGDTLFIYGDYLFYDGQAQLAQLRRNVRLINRNTELTTDSLNYDRVYSYGYYFDGGTLTDEENVLTSLWGEYNTSTKIAVFNHSVLLENPRFTLTSDTLKYNIVLQEFPQCKPVVSGRLHTGNHSGFTVFFCDILHPCLECQETGFCVAKLQRLLGKLVVTPVKSSGKMSLAADVNTNNQSFFSNGCNFCVLCVKIHFRYLSV